MAVDIITPPATKITSPAILPMQCYNPHPFLFLFLSPTISKPQPTPPPPPQRDNPSPVAFCAGFIPFLQTPTFIPFLQTLKRIHLSFKLSHTFLNAKRWCMKLQIQALDLQRTNMQLNPKPQTPNPKPQTPNPKPQPST